MDSDTSLHLLPGSASSYNVHINSRWPVGWVGSEGRVWKRLWFLNDYPGTTPCLIATVFYFFMQEKSIFFIVEITF